MFLVACSGGPDSLALAAACGFELPRAGYRVGAAVIDHGLQPGSDEVASAAASSCKELGLDPVIVKKVVITESGEGLEAAARAARYQALEEVRQDLSASYVLLGHNLEDQAETVLMGLTRGSGLKSISGMPVVDQQRRLARPLIEMPKASLRQACMDQGIEFWDDPHNLDDSFLRVRLRKLSGELEETLGTGFQAALARTAELAFEADDYLAMEAGAILSSADSESGLEVTKLVGLHPALRRKTLQLYLQEASKGSIPRSQVLEAEQLVINWHGQKKLDLSGITVERVNDRLLVRAN